MSDDDGGGSGNPWNPPDPKKILPFNPSKQRPKSAEKPRPSWLVGAVTDERGRITPNVANILLALRRAPELMDAFSFDDMAKLDILCRRLPLVEGAQHAKEIYPRPLRDDDITRTQEWLQRQGMPKIGFQVTHQAIEERARELLFHPVRDYLNGLAWDKKPRVEIWLSYYLGAEPSPYVSGIGRMFLVAMVARIYEPGCKADYMPVLEGEQGGLKSTACQIIGGKWFSDSLPPIGRKDASEHLRDKWLIEIGELSAIDRADIEALKLFITRREERYRPSYGRKEVIEPRQCVFVGTTNKSAYLKDETGGRRFWPVKTGQIDIDALSTDRDQLLAEAVHRYRTGEKWWPAEEFERALIKPQQEIRYEVDPWEEAISSFVETLSEVRLASISQNVLGMEIKQVGRREQNRIVGVLTRLGFEKGDRDELGRMYVRKGRFAAGRYS
jgi:predicted P-loop ATPase